MKIRRLSNQARREIEEQNEARMLAGLSLIEIKVLKCPSCEKHFESAGNRTCGCLDRVNYNKSKYDLGG